MTRDEILLVKQIVREIAKEEIASAIQSFSEELKKSSQPEKINPVVEKIEKEKKPSFNP